MGIALADRLGPGPFVGIPNAEPVLRLLNDLVSTAGLDLEVLNAAAPATFKVLYPLSEVSDPRISTAAIRVIEALDYPVQTGSFLHSGGDTNSIVARNPHHQTMIEKALDTAQMSLQVILSAFDAPKPSVLATVDFTPSVKETIPTVPEVPSGEVPTPPSDPKPTPRPRTGKSGEHSTPQAKAGKRNQGPFPISRAKPKVPDSVVAKKSPALPDSPSNGDPDWWDENVEFSETLAAIEESADAYSVALARIGSTLKPTQILEFSQLMRTARDFAQNGLIEDNELEVVARIGIPLLVAEAGRTGDINLNSHRHEIVNATISVLRVMCSRKAPIFAEVIATLRGIFDTLHPRLPKMTGHRLVDLLGAPVVEDDTVEFRMP